MRKLIASLFLLALVLLTGCVASLPQTGSNYTRSEVRSEQEVRFGTVKAVRKVKIEGSRGFGTLVGAFAGGAVGSVLGNGQALAKLAGAVGGVVLSDKLSDSSVPGEELTIRLEDGKIVAIVQETDAESAFRRGDKVRIIGKGSTSRVGLVDDRT